MRELRRDALSFIWLAAGIVAIALTVSVASDDVLAGELRVVREVQDWPVPGDGLADVIRALTTTWLVLVLGVLLALALFATGHRTEAVVLLAMLFVLPWLQAGLKDLVDRPRPDPEQVDVRGEITSESFPAGHVMGPTVLYGYGLYVSRFIPETAVRSLAVALCAGVLLLTGIVNVWLGVHWPSDVIGGHLWGLVILMGGIWAARFAERMRT